MADASDLHDFRNVCRLFPLPRVVHFPHAVMPLHIFEPRYRQMTEDALEAGDGLITIVQLRGGAAGPGLGDPPVEEVACLGRILQHQRLPDGRFNFLLLGLSRVRLTRELPSDRLYRLAEAELLEDRQAGAPDDRLGAELLAMFRQLIGHDRPLDPGLEALLEMEVPLGVMTDLVSNALAVGADVKQALLDETLVTRRAQLLREILGQLLDAGATTREPRSFPPPFSLN